MPCPFLKRLLRSPAVIRPEQGAGRGRGCDFRALGWLLRARGMVEWGRALRCSPARGGFTWLWGGCLS